MYRRPIKNKKELQGGERKVVVRTMQCGWKTAALFQILPLKDRKKCVEE